MPAALARAAIVGTSPPSDFDMYQIHMPFPSNAVPLGATVLWRAIGIGGRIRTGPQVGEGGPAVPRRLACPLGGLAVTATTNPWALKRIATPVKRPFRPPCGRRGKTTIVVPATKCLPWTTRSPPACTERLLAQSVR